jgi:hypothetical protein
MRVQIKRRRIVGICLVVGVAFSGVAAMTATAEVPELGRCTKVAGVMEGKKTVYSGGYTSPHCTKAKPGHDGKYEWTPGPGAQNKFFGVGEEPELETVGGVKITCSSATFKGEYTGPKTEKVGLSLQLCEDAAKRACQTTPAKSGEIAEVGTLEGTLAFVNSAKATAGWDLKREGGTGPILTYYCGTLPESVKTVEGSVIGQLKGGFFADLNKMSKFSRIGYVASKGKQVPEAFEGLPVDVLTTTTSGVEQRSPEQTGLTTLEATTSGEGNPVEEESKQEALEVKTKAK